MSGKKSCFVISLMLLAVLFFALFIPAFAESEQTTATQTKETQEQNEAEETLKTALFNSPDGRILCVAKQGAVSAYPENSVEGIKYAIKKGADAVEVDVNMTSDEVLILMKDNDFSRMCVDPSGETMTGKVSETESWEVMGMHLRQGRGGEANEKTDCHPPTLEDAVKAVGDDGALIINFDWSLRDKVYEAVKSLGAFDRVIFKVYGQKGSVSRWIKDSENPNLNVMTAYSGNVVFSVRGYVKKSEKAGVGSIQLSVKNPYGVIFHRTVLSLFDENARAVIDMTNPALCGGRADDEVGWNDLSSKGYSVIITDYPERLVSYIKNTESEKSSLASLTEKIEKLDLNSYSAISKQKVERELKKAESLLTRHTSKQALNEQYYSLNEVYKSLEAGDGASGGRTVTAGRIIAAVLISALFVFSQLIVYRHSVKTEKGAVRR